MKDAGTEMNAGKVWTMKIGRGMQGYQKMQERAVGDDNTAINAERHGQ